MRPQKMEGISDFEWTALSLTNAFHTYRHAFRSLRELGLRVTELVGLRHEDIDLRHDRLIVRDAKHPEHVREISLTHLQQHRICYAMRDSTSDTFVFSSPTGSKLNRDVLRRALEKAAREARIERWLTLQMIRKMDLNQEQS